MDVNRELSSEEALDEEGNVNGAKLAEIGVALKTMACKRCGAPSRLILTMLLHDNDGLGKIRMARGIPEGTESVSVVLCFPCVETMLARFMPLSITEMARQNLDLD